MSLFNQVQLENEIKLEEHNACLQERMDNIVEIAVEHVNRQVLEDLKYQRNIKRTIINRYVQIWLEEVEISPTYYDSPSYSLPHGDYPGQYNVLNYSEKVSFLNKVKTILEQEDNYKCKIATYPYGMKYKTLRCRYYF